jgi:Rad3-related DNA helicase
LKFCPKCEIKLRKIFEKDSATIQSFECDRCGYTKTVNNSHREKSSIEIARETYPNAYTPWKDSDVKDIEEYWLLNSETKTKKEMIEQLSKRFGRNIGAIESQLNHMGYGYGLFEELKNKNGGKTKSEIDKKPDEQSKDNSETKFVQNNSQELRFEDVYPEGFEQDEQKNQIISDIKKAVGNKKKFVIVSAPTGSGKSWIAGTLSLQLGQGTILTKQKSLQDQYIRDFDFMNPVKGKSNFDCAKHMMEKKCSEGNCDNCEYKCTSTDFTIKNSGKNEEVSVNNENFIPYLSLSGSKLELNSSKIQMNDNQGVILAEQKLSEDDKKFLDDADDSWTFAIKHNNTNYFVLPSDIIPDNAEVCKDPDDNLILQKKEMCRYWMQREIGKKSFFSVYNYPAYISTRLHEDRKEELERTNPKKVLICDEAQHLPQELVSESTIEVKYDFFRKLGLDSDVNDCKIYAEANQVEKVRDLLKGILERCQEEQKKINYCRFCLKFLKSRKHINEHRTADNCIKHKTLRAKKCKDCKKFKEDFVDRNEHLKCSIHHEEHVEEHVEEYNKKIPCNKDHSSMTDEWINE